MAKNLNEARSWFLSHSSGTLTCRGADGTTREIASYPDAEVFFGKHGES